MRRLLVAIMVAMLIGGLASIERAQARELESLTVTEQVDMGVTLHVVRKSPDGKKIKRPKPADILRTHYLGGLVQVGGVPDGWDVDEHGPPPSAFYVGMSRNPVVWMCSEAQEPLILHSPDRPAWSLIQGSEGAGKSVALVMWTGLRALDNVGRNVTGAITVPTTPRFRAVKKEIAKIWPAHWCRWRERDHSYQFHIGVTVQIVSAVQRSEAGGSPLQGDSLEWCGSDEMQDHFGLEADIMSRGRGSDRYLRLCTSTSKDSTEWRDHRSKVVASSLWSFTKMLGMDSPFVDAKFWTDYRASGTVTEREWRRRILAEDVGPEKQVYFNWRRTFENGKPANLRRVPPGARDITAEVMAPWQSHGQPIGLLIGHDPGERKQVSVFLKAYRLPEQPARDTRPRWFVVDEVTSPEATVQAHALQVLQRARERWECNTLDRFGRLDPDAPQVLVRIDPHTQGGEEHPGSDVGVIWRQLGMVARAAKYRTGSTQPGQIKKRQRIDLVNTLLAATAEVGEVRRLFVAINEDGSTAAPMLVKAFESMETGDSEKKDEHDQTHWPAALGYALISVAGPRNGFSEEMAA